MNLIQHFGHARCRSFRLTWLALLLALALPGNASARVEEKDARFESDSTTELDSVVQRGGSFSTTSWRFSSPRSSAHAYYDGGGETGSAQGNWNVAWGAGDEVRFGGLFWFDGYHFFDRNHARVDVMRWDNYATRGEEADYTRVQVGTDDNGYLEAGRYSGGWRILAGPFDIPRDRWVWLQVRQKLSAIPGEALNEVFVDGKKVGATSTAPNLTGGRQAEQLSFGLVRVPGQTAPLRLWLDNLWIEPIASAPADGGTENGATAPPDPGSCGGGLAELELGQTPPGCWRPYGATSPFNQQLPPSPRLHPDSAAIVGWLNGRGSPEALLGNVGGSDYDWGHPTYYSRPSDPTYTVHCTEWWGACPLEGKEVRVPSAAKAAGTGPWMDAHMTVVDPASGWEYDFWRVQNKPDGGGRLDTSWGGRTRLEGDGLGSDATAARFGNLAGIIRAEELEAGKIDHALFFVAGCDNGTWVYPAQKGGAHCAGSNAPPMGARLQLAMSAEAIDALSVPSWKKTILHALREYGMYMGDTGGGATSFGLQFESGMTYRSFGASERLAAYGESANVPKAYDPALGRNVYRFDFGSGIDWRRLRVIAPCVSERTC